MTDDYWGPMPDDSEYPTPRERLDDGEADRLRALLRRWVRLGHWGYVTGSTIFEPKLGSRCRGCDGWAYSRDDIEHRSGCVVGDTLKELGGE